MEELKKTPLYDKHVQLGAKIVPFAGYLMPVQYRGIVEEHLNVRNKAGIFDVSHMGEFIISGRNAGDFVNYVTTNDVRKLVDGQAQYSVMCYPDGGIVDDLLVYRFPDYFMMVVNASNIQKDFEWLKGHLSEGVELKNVSEEIALIAVQGPYSRDILQNLTDFNLREIAFYHFAEVLFAGRKVVISRTGYTGELGFEIYHSPEYSEYLWDEIMNAGEKYDLMPAGLGARDTLRLEMKYALYGNDIDQTTNPIEAGLGWVVKLDKGDFIGRESLERAKREGVKRKLVAFVLEDKGIPRHGYGILSEEGDKIGHVTSGSISPVLNKPIGLGYVLKEYSGIGTEIYIDYRGKKLKAKVVKPPFVPSRVDG